MAKKSNELQREQEREQRRKSINKALRQTTVTITVSICALAMGVVLIALSYMQEQKISIVGIIVVVGMIFNMLPAFRRRRELQEEYDKVPKPRANRK